MTDDLVHTPLHDLHVSFGARMVPFAGWLLPVSFSGVKEEHEHTRNACSVFDVSHMGRLRLSGADGEAFLNRLCTRNLAEAEVGRSYYSHICREDGGILDDVIVSRFEADWGVVCNGANRDKIVRWMEKQRDGFDVAVSDETMSTVMVAIQGPETMDLVRELIGLDPATLKRYHFATREYFGSRIVLYRSGYTGEDGLEVVAPANIAKMLIPIVLGTKERPRRGVRPAGLAARDTLRIEAGMPLYGHELSEAVDPLTAGQGWCADLSVDFIGAAAMREAKARGLARRLVGLEVEGRRIARQDHKVFDGDTAVGAVTSGTLGPTVGKSIAMAFVAAGHYAEGTVLSVELGKNRVSARVVKLPFYKRPT